MQEKKRRPGWPRRLIVFVFVLVLVLVLVFLGYELYLEGTTGRSHIFAYQLRYPKDFADIFYTIPDHIDILCGQIEMRGARGGPAYPNAQELFGYVGFLDIAQDQPLEGYNIILLKHNETGTVYLYKGDFNYVYLAEAACPESWQGLLLVNKALKENMSTGVYYGFDLSREGNDWIALATGSSRRSVVSRLVISIRDTNHIPPIPGCLYDEEQKKMFVPKELVSAYKIIYPNVEIPAEMILENNECVDQLW